MKKYKIIFDETWGSFFGEGGERPGTEASAALHPRSSGGQDTRKTGDAGRERLLIDAQDVQETRLVY
jgi:hypothetical protein